MVHILRLQFSFMVSHSHFLLRLVNINQKSNYKKKKKTLHVNYSINDSETEIYIDEIQCIINDDDRCDRMNGVLYISLTDKKLCNMVKLSWQTSQIFLRMCV